jgi:hypothetical protein
VFCLAWSGCALCTKQNSAGACSTDQASILMTRPVSSSAAPLDVRLPASLRLGVGALHIFRCPLSARCDKNVRPHPHRLASRAGESYTSGTSITSSGCSLAATRRRLPLAASSLTPPPPPPPPPPVLLPLPLRSCTAPCFSVRSGVGGESTATDCGGVGGGPGALVEVPLLLLPPLG